MPLKTFQEIRVSKIWIGPTGAVTKGHVLDVAIKPFVRALKAHDAQLYVKWNPRKLAGHGCWEIRRKPESTTIVDFAEFEGNTYVNVGYWENNIISHVLDVAFLNYDQIRKIKRMDTFAVGPKQWAADFEYAEKKAEEARVAKRNSNTSYAAKHFDKEIKEFQDYVLAGGNPHMISAHWDSIKPSE